MQHRSSITNKSDLTFQKQKHSQKFFTRHPTKETSCSDQNTVAVMTGKLCLNRSILICEFQDSSQTFVLKISLSVHPSVCPSILQVVSTLCLSDVISEPSSTPSIYLGLKLPSLGIENGSFWFTVEQILKRMKYFPLLHNKTQRFPYFGQD